VKIVIFGLTVSSSWGNGHATLWRGLCRGLAEIGHHVTFFERDVPYYANARDLTELPGGGELLLYSDWKEVIPLARDRANSADAVIVTSYCPDAIVASNMILESRAALKVFYDLDTGVTLARLAAGLPVGYVGPRGYRDFDLVLSYTGGSALKELQDLVGAKRVAPLYGSADPSVHRPVPAKDRFRSTVSYLGTYSADRDEALRTLFLEPALRLPASRFFIGGSKYDADFPWLPNIFFAGHVSPADHSAFYCSSKLTLNVTRGPMARTGYCPSGRLFEAAACGVPLLSDYWPGLETFYRLGTEILVATSVDEALEVINMPPEELARIGEAARDRTLTCHTAAIRARELEALLTGALNLSEESIACGA
jgi:spore maturation protein CgeB